MRLPIRYALTILCVVLFSTEPVSANDVGSSVPVTAIIIDAGHGGHDPGARSSYPGGPVEKDVVLDIALRLRAELQRMQPDINIVMTRETDVFITLEERSAIARAVDPGLSGQSILISIHTNGSTSESPAGFELLIKEHSKRVAFFGKDIEPWRLVRYAQENATQLNQNLNLANLALARSLETSIASMFPSMRDRGVKEQDVWVLNASAIPSVLVETSFITNTEEARLMQDDVWLSKMALAIAEGVLAYSGL